MRKLLTVLIVLFAVATALFGIRMLLLSHSQNIIARDRIESENRLMESTTDQKALIDKRAKQSQELSDLATLFDRVEKDREALRQAAEAQAKVRSSRPGKALADEDAELAKEAVTLRGQIESKRKALDDVQKQMDSLASQIEKETAHRQQLIDESSKDVSSSGALWPLLFSLLGTIVTSATQITIAIINKSKARQA